MLYLVENEEAPKKKKNKKNKKKSKAKQEVEEEVNYFDQLENKLKWAVDEVTKFCFSKRFSLVVFVFLVNQITKSQSYQ